MYAILAEVINYTQLMKIKPGLFAALEEKFTQLAEAEERQFKTEKNGLYYFDFLNDENIDPKQVIEFTYRIREILNDNSNELFGYNILILQKNKALVTDFLAEKKEMLISLPQDSCVWLTHPDKKSFSEFVKLEEQSGFYKMLERKIDTEDLSIEKKPVWKRKNALNMILDAITPILNNEKPNEILYIYGPPSTGKTMLIDQVAKIIMKKNQNKYLRLYTRFRKQSYIHPFLNSIKLNFLNEIIHHLKPYQQALWKETHDLLRYLKTYEATDKCPDHIFEDFYITYNLYLSAYIQSMKKDLLPALFVCDDFQAYHAKTLKALSLIFKDFLSESLFMPVIVSTEPAIPEEFNDFPITRIEINPVSLLEIRSFIHTMYPGLNATKLICKAIDQYASGDILKIFFLFLYLEKSRKIKKSIKLFSWAMEDNENPESWEFPDKEEIVFWLISKGMSRNTQEVLFFIYFSGGLLTKQRLTQFLVSKGYHTELLIQIYQYLKEMKIISYDEYFFIKFPQLFPQIERHLGEKSAFLKQLFIDYIMQLTESRKLNNNVLLFSLFKNSRKYNKALTILKSLIKQKLDEYNLEGVKPYLILKNLSFYTYLKSEHREHFKVILLSSELRMHLLENKIPEATAVFNKIGATIPTFNSSPYRGTLFLNIARYQLAQCEIDKAMSAVKSALMDFQDYSDVEDKAITYTEMGCIKIAEEKADDAVDYLEMADRILPIESHTYDRIKILTLEGIAFFLLGNLSKASQMAEKGREIANSMARRDLELFLTFFKGRIKFELGQFKEALKEFQDCLLLSYIYSVFEAEDTINAWIARTFIYKNKMEVGIRILKGLKSSKEVNFYLSEAYFFLGENTKAGSYLDQCSIGEGPDRQETVTSLINIISWKNGYSSIEGKLMRLDKKSTLFDKVIRAFSAYVKCHYGKNEEGLQELYNINRTESYSKIDPYTSYYSYLYSSALYKDRDNPLDDALTILNKAVKQLQERASKIEVSIDRSNYLYVNFWNKKLIDEAKERNLI
ncbi:MAG: ATP-binding protein [Spirochaetales bacterium]|nr:ATP-binding protein [Spirochaetales bacterium]